MSESRTIDPTLLESWIQVFPDNTIGYRTGVADFGQGTVSTTFRQIVAEELRVPFEMVSQVVSGDTDRTPGGGIAAGFLDIPHHQMLHGELGRHPDSLFGRDALNIQKAAAFTYAALLERASRVLEVSVGELTAADGEISSGTRRIAYFELVNGEPLNVKLEIAGSSDSHFGVLILGTPPVVPPSEFRVLGTSSPDPRIPATVTGEADWLGDIRLPGMLHGRMVHPPTLGSELVSVGTLDPDDFASAEVIVMKNFVGVVASDEWEAIRAAESLATSSQWTGWQGLPGSDQLIEAMLDTDWSQVPVTASDSDGTAVSAALEAAPHVLNAFFSLPYYKHTPMGPETCVADVREDGQVHLWTHSQQFQELRVYLAVVLETDPSNLVLHHARHAGNFGRSTKGDGGAEAEAALLSRACGRPVRLQWSRAEDFAWSRQQAPYLGEVSLGLDVDGRMLALKAAHHMPGSLTGQQQGALLAGLPSEPAGSVVGYLNQLWMEWPYDRVSNVYEEAHAAPDVADSVSPLGIGIRHRQMRSPVHLQQNFAIESMVSEAAAAAGVDPIEYRLSHTSDPRLVRVLEAVRTCSGWESRPSPAPSARSQGGGLVQGRGLGLAIRAGSYFASVAEVTVDLDSGKVAVDRYWLAADVGFVFNPTMLRSNLEGGTVMGLSQALHEETSFDSSSITSIDFRGYPILTMAEMPQLEVEIIEPKNTSVAGQGSEATNMLPPVALTGAIFDATGIAVRRLPLRPKYVLAELRGS